MTLGSAPSPILHRSDLRPPRRARRRALWGFCAAATVVLLGFAGAVWEWSGATLVADTTALARVEVQPFGGTLEHAQLFGPGGRAIALSVRNDRLTPQVRLTPGERVSAEVVIRRPGWLAWALGSKRRERLTLRAPVAHVSERWLTVPLESAVQVRFDRPVSAVAEGANGHLVFRVLDSARRSITLPRRAAAGSLAVAVAARSWERLGSPVAVSWFPPARSPILLSSPAPGAQLTPAAPIRLTFSKPLAAVFVTARPKLSPRTPGRWQQADSHTLVFVSSGFGAGFSTKLRVELPRAVAVVGRAGRGLHTTRRLDWTVQPGSPLRLQQLLAQAGYLPLDWQPSGPTVARTPHAELQAAVDPPKGTFSWRFPNTPRELRALWSPGRPSEITRGAVMMFEDSHALAVDGLAGAAVWHALLADAIAGKRRVTGYSYVYVHSSVPQSLTLWHDGHTVLSSPGNTGVPAAPTQLGTFPVFEHIPVGTMSGTNPDGSHYDDPGIRYISYFNGGDAIHAFNRASFGTPQSLGCVELPLASAAKVWPYTPIGTLVTIEN
ncbi:MAG: L,D-transpeptidase [Actinobacteria bacterium]|nr:MAG: L,D-transpeptidase [Actinomycetota bacterium]